MLAFAARRLIANLRRAFFVWRAHNPELLAAGLSFFALFSLIPLTVLTITIVGLVFTGSGAQEMVLAEMAEVFSPDAAESVSVLLGRVERSAGSASVVSAVILIWVGSRIFIMMQRALTYVWQFTPPTLSRMSRVKVYVGNRLRALLATLGLGLIAFVFLVLDVVLNSFRGLLAWFLPPVLVFQILPAASLFASVVLFAVAFAMIYRWLPGSHPGWKAVWSGAAVASILFAAGRGALSVYFQHTNLLSLFGAAGSVAVILVWVYYSMQILLFGAAFAAVIGGKNNAASQQPDESRV